MKNMYKPVYIALSVLILVYLGLFTAANLLIYGSVMQINVPLFILVLVFPLYLGFKQKNFRKFASLFMVTYFCLVMVITLLILPDVTFKEARSKVEAQGAVWELHLKRYTDNPGYFYAGDYLVKTDQGDYKVDVNTGEIEKMEVK